MADEAFKRTLKKAVDLVAMRTITSDMLMAMHGDDYQVIRRLATRARLDRQPRYVCGMCGYAVYAPREGRTGRPYWKHHFGAPPRCPWWTGTPETLDAVSARQFDGSQESPLHANIKRIVGELLAGDPRTKAGSVIVDEYLILENGRRRPDVRAVYDGAHLVVEVQLATTQIPIIVQREDFYEQAGFRLLWLTWNFEPPVNGRLLSSFEDIFYSHDKNLFSMDDETIVLSKERGQVVFRALWVNDDVWHSKLVSLNELNWLKDGRANAVPSNPPWRTNFLARWRAATHPKGTEWEERQRLFGELVDKLNLRETVVANLEEIEIDSLINCLLSLLDGKPVGSRQKNVVEVLNTFFNVERRHRYARLVHTFGNLMSRQQVLGTESVRRKFANAYAAKQDDRQSVSGRIALALFPDIFASKSRDLVRSRRR